MLMNDISSPCSGTQRGWTMEANNLMDWQEHAMDYYAEINPTNKQFETGILCALRFRTLWEIIQCYPTFMEYKGFGPTDLRILYDAKVLGGWEDSRNVLYHLENCHKVFFVPLSLHVTLSVH